MTVTQESFKEVWEGGKRREAFHRSLKLWDKKLSKLNDEMLHYILMRVTSILDFRAEQARQKDCTDA